MLSRPVPPHSRDRQGSRPRLTPAASHRPLIRPASHSGKPKPGPEPQINKGSSNAPAGRGQGVATPSPPAGTGLPRGAKEPGAHKKVAPKVAGAAPPPPAAAAGSGRGVATRVNRGAAVPASVAPPKRAIPLDRPPREAQRPAEPSLRPASGGAKLETPKPPPGRVSNAGAAGTKSERRGAPMTGAVAGRGSGRPHGSGGRGNPHPPQHEGRKPQKRMQNPPRLMQEPLRVRDPLSQNQQKLYGGMQSPATRVRGATEVRAPHAAREMV